jgi:ferredoxin
MLRGSQRSDGSHIPCSSATSAQDNNTGPGLALGPISQSFGTEFGDAQHSDRPEADSSGSHAEPNVSIHSMTTEAWRSRFEKDGTVDLWMEEEFNAGSRLVVGAGGGEWDLKGSWGQ